ncbi:MAG: GNAT family N-acetyltransferase [Dehalococcoidia bacterium]
MAIEIRAAREDELAKVHDVVALSFNGDRSEQGRQGFMHVEKMAHPTVLLENGKIVASLRVYDFVTRVNGAEIPMGGVSSVSCYPEHRRKGYVGKLLIDAMAKMRDKGQPLSALYTPHPSLYRKFGYMTAATNVRYEWKPKAVRPYNKARPAGKAIRVGEGDWRVLEQVYDRASGRRTGSIKRTEALWRESVFRRFYDPERKLKDVTVWYGVSGEPEGYATYTSQRVTGPVGGDKTLLWVAEFQALTSDAYVGLLRYILSHDLNDEIYWYGPIDDPLALAVDDAMNLKREVVDDYMLRVIDVVMAIAGRPAGAGASEGTFTIGIEDETCPWNSGSWEIENAGGRLTATKGGTPDLSMEAATFAAVYDGHLRASDAVRSGLAEATASADLALADRVLASDYPPNGSDFF